MEDNIDYMKQVSDCVMPMLDHYNTGISQEQFYRMNIVDVTDVSEDDMRAANAGVIQYCRDNGCYAALPPFEEGAFIDRQQGRYVHWKVLEVCEDNFKLALDHYPIISVDEAVYLDDYSACSRKCWYLSSHVLLTVKLLTSDEHQAMMSHHPDYVRYASSFCGSNPAKMKELLAKLSNQVKAESYVGGVINDYTYNLPQSFAKICKKGKYYTPDGEFVNASWIRATTDVNKSYVAERLNAALHTVLFGSAGPIIEMFTYVNYMLSKKSEGTSTLRHIESVYMPAENSEESRKERHFGSIKVVSEKKPKPVTEHNMQRIYTMVAWQRRSHLRHLASGKIVPVKSATCRRHNTDNAEAPQVVYKV